jgi:YfiH family protein
MSLAWLQPEWPAPPAVRAACTLRSGGRSAAPYASLNLGAHVGDDAAAVAGNRQRLRAALGLPAEPLWLAQVHGTCVVDADRAGLDVATVPRADAAITRHRGRVLAVLVADCMPVLLCRRDGAAVAVAHAGWRGLAAGILEATVEALATPGEQLLAWLGPAIGPMHFEVGAEVRAAFCDGDAEAAQAFRVNARGRWQCDLRGLARRRLERLGLQSIHVDERCSYAQADCFFSHRRDGVTGRFAALIWIDAGMPA